MHNTTASALLLLTACTNAEPAPPDARILSWTGTVPAWVILPSGTIEFKVTIGPEPGKVSITNADETIEVPVVVDDGGTLTLRFDDYDSEIVCKPSDDSGRVLAGEWVKRRGAKGAENEFVRLPFHLNGRGFCGTTTIAQQPGEQERAIATLAANTRWSVRFADDEDPAVLQFSVLRTADGRPRQITRATFLTTTGDYRYLTPTIVGDTVTMACFDGAHAFLFTSRLLPDGTLKGDFASGPTYRTTWTATPDPDAKLPDAFSIARVVPGVDPSALRYPGLDGVERPLIQLAGKGEGPRAHIIEVFGTWCPNCRDATALLKELHARYAGQGLEIVGLAFEVTGDRGRDLKQLGVYRERHGVAYAMLLGGTTDKAKAQEAFPVLDKVHAYPTFLFVDRAGVVRAVYAGFTGPAAEAEHAELKARFVKIIESMLAD